MGRRDVGQEMENVREEGKEEIDFHNTMEGKGKAAVCVKEDHSFSQTQDEESKDGKEKNSY